MRIVRTTLLVLLGIAAVSVALIAVAYKKDLVVVLPIVGRFGTQWTRVPRAVRAVRKCARSRWMHQASAHPGKLGSIGEMAWDIIGSPHDRRAFTVQS